MNNRFPALWIQNKEQMNKVIDLGYALGFRYMQNNIQTAKKSLSTRSDGKSLVYFQFKHKYFHDTGFANIKDLLLFNSIEHLKEYLSKHLEQ